MTREKTTSSDHIADDKLQRYFDGDLTEGEARVVARDIERSEMEQARLSQLDRLSALMADRTENLEFDADALFSRIKTAVAADTSPRLRVVGGDLKKRRVWTSVAVGLAMAAAVALAFYYAPADAPVAIHPMDEPREALATNDPEVEIHPPAGSEVEEIDFGTNTGTVFEVEGAEGQPLAVVWIAEDTF